MRKFGAVESRTIVELLPLIVMSLVIRRRPVSPNEAFVDAADVSVYAHDATASLFRLMASAPATVLAVTIAAFSAVTSPHGTLSVAPNAVETVSSALAPNTNATTSSLNLRIAASPRDGAASTGPVNGRSRKGASHR